LKITSNYSCESACAQMIYIILIIIKMSDENLIIRLGMGSFSLVNLIGWTFERNDGFNLVNLYYVSESKFSTKIYSDLSNIAVNALNNYVNFTSRRILEERNKKICH